MGLRLALSMATQIVLNLQSSENRPPPILKKLDTLFRDRVIPVKLNDSWPFCICDILYVPLGFGIALNCT